MRGRHVTDVTQTGMILVNTIFLLVEDWAGFEVRAAGVTEWFESRSVTFVGGLNIFDSEFIWLMGAPRSEWLA